MAGLPLYGKKHSPGRLKTLNATVSDLLLRSWVHGERSAEDGRTSCMLRSTHLEGEDLECYGE